jgi:osmotically-inducible protein OsmY
MRSDIEIKRDVEAELGWSPDLDERDIAVKVDDAVVMLTGFVHSYFEKSQAENAVKRVKGVAGVANDIQVRLAIDHALADPEIARAAVAALRSVLPTSHENIKLVVNQGWLTLEGSIEWYFQKQLAESAVRYLKGVTGVSNHVLIKPRIAPTDIKRRIEEAFRRSAEVDAGRVRVEAHDSEVTLAGTVRSWAERDEAQQTAWSAPGVTRVKNEITVRT